MTFFQSGLFAPATLLLNHVAGLWGNSMTKAIITSLLGALLSMAAFHFAMAHGGGTDANGCHHDHKRGGYHCH